MMIKTLLVGFGVLALLTGGCGDEEQSPGGDVAAYISELDRLLDNLVVSIESSGDQDSPDTFGASAWEQFRAQLETLDPPAALAQEHKSLVDAVDNLSVNLDRDGVLLADAFTQSCNAIERKAAILGTQVDLSCE